MPHVLLIGVDPGYRDGLARHLQGEGFAATVLAGAEAIDRFLGEPHLDPAGRADAALLGPFLPDGDALGVLRSLRRSDILRAMPVLLLTSSSDEIDLALGLEPGADDFLSAPFGFREASARLRALLRRSAFVERQPRGQVLRHRGVELDLDLHLANRSGEPLDLTRREFELLAYFLKQPGRVLPRERILHEVWGLEYLGESRTIDAHVRRLRAKLGEDAAGIETIVGVGYRLADSGAASR